LFERRFEMSFSIGMRFVSKDGQSVGTVLTQVNDIEFLCQFDGEADPRTIEAQLFNQWRFYGRHEGSAFEADLRFYQRRARIAREA
jgi:hypothetical protein